MALIPSGSKMPITDKKPEPIKLPIAVAPAKIAQETVTFVTPVPVSSKKKK
jgi:hypothetical protein